MQKGHVIILENLLNSVMNKKIYKVLDAGSGKTSLQQITSIFPDSQIDAIIYPGDVRKLKGIKPLLTEQIRLLEWDICKTPLEGTYDLVVAHLLLGEAGKFGNVFQNLLDKLLMIDSKYYIIIDYVEDPTVEEKVIRECCSQKQYEIIEEIYRECPEPQVWKDFTGYHNFGYLIQNNLIEL